MDPIDYTHGPAINFSRRNVSGCGKLETGDHGQKAGKTARPGNARDLLSSMVHRIGCPVISAVHSSDTALAGCGTGCLRDP